MRLSRLDSAQLRPIALSKHAIFTQARLQQKGNAYMPTPVPQLAIFCFLLSNSMTVFAESAGILHDPFSQPPLKRSRSIVDSEQPSESTQGTWQPHLSSTLRAGKNSMVIVSSRVMKLGEDFKGYKLIHVYERTAIFLKDDKQIRLSLDGNE